MGSIEKFVFAWDNHLEMLNAEIISKKYSPLIASYAGSISSDWQDLDLTKIGFVRRSYKNQNDPFQIKPSIYLWCDDLKAIDENGVFSFEDSKDLKFETYYEVWSVAKQKDGTIIESRRYMHFETEAYRISSKLTFASVRSDDCSRDSANSRLLVMVYFSQINLEKTQKAWVCFEMAYEQDFSDAIQFEKMRIWSSMAQSEEWATLFFPFKRMKLYVRARVVVEGEEELSDAIASRNLAYLMPPCDDYYVDGREYYGRWP